MMLKTLSLSLVEGGKIKIGGKGDERKTQSGGSFNLPVKFDGFVITKLNKSTQNFDVDIQLMAKLGGWDNEKKQIIPLKSIPIAFPFDNPEVFFSSRMACYDGKQCICSGDGDTAVDINGSTLKCSCEKCDPNYAGKMKCKPNGKLNVNIIGSDLVGSTYVFRTTGYNSINAIMSSIFTIMSETGGRLRGAGFHLVYNTKTIIDAKGKTQTVPVISVEYRGSRTKLREAIENNALKEAQYLGAMKHLEGLAIQFKEQPMMALDDIPEFYPDAQDHDALTANTVLPEKQEEILEIQHDDAKKEEPTREELVKILEERGFTEEDLKGKRQNTLQTMIDEGVQPEKRIVENDEKKCVESPQEQTGFVDYGDQENESESQTSVDFGDI